MRQHIIAAILAGSIALTGCTPAAPPPPPPAAPAPPPAPVAPAAPRPAAPAQATAAPDGLPEGPGRAETVAGCSGCHGLGQIMGEHRDREAWTTTVTSMINNGAPVADADFDKVVAYLTAHFGPQ